MNSHNNLEITGNLREHCLPELLAEIFQAKLNGSLRLESAAQKTVVYFDAGDVVFAVSNARRFRLFELLLSENKISKQQLAAIADFTNDFALKENLTKTDFLPKREIERIFSLQMENILKDAFDWSEGEWNFSPLVRVKGDIRFKVGAFFLLVEYARNLPDDKLPHNFKNSSDEVFAVKSAPLAHINLQPAEAFVFSRFENSSLSLEKAILFSGLSETETLRILNTLWLGGFLSRRNWRSPFSERQLSMISTASFSLKKNGAETLPPVKISETKLKTVEEIKSAVPAATFSPVAASISLEEYLRRVETAANHYQLFEVAADAPASEIKTAYFTLAKLFHPDLFHREVGAARHLQIQNAFTKIAQAYETLKNESSREVYDYKMRKELAAETAQNGGSKENRNLPPQAKQAAEDFERGFDFLMDENYENAIPFLARAAHLIQNNARYRAYYGKALSTDAKQKHKAEAELQAAIRLEPDNADFRLMLAEFFVQMQLLKRAEGELNRLLTIFPSNKAARAMLDNLAER